ncbi:hypothetical protein [Streptomyces sp. NPDC088752]|uniref:hypothetical protein n=1 Tax=Streptomyces sp. NPDC088752 TaxID=3154963 RepID=UPI00343300D6
MNFDPLAGKWIRCGGKYYYCRGTAPNGQPRVIPMNRVPHGKTVHVYDDAKGVWNQEKVAFKLRPGTRFFLFMTLVALVTVPLLFADQDPILWKVCTPVAVGFFLLASCVAQGAGLYPHDAISQAEADREAWESYQESQRIGAERAARQQQQDLAAMRQGQMAIWAQLAQLNASAHPNQDTYRPYGQSPPL